MALPEGKTHLIPWNDLGKGQKLQLNMTNEAEVEEHKFVVPSLAWLYDFSLTVQHLCIYRENSACSLDPYLGLPGRCV